MPVLARRPIAHRRQPDRARLVQVLAKGNLRGAIAAAEAGEAIAPNESVAVQLVAQRAKAWARLGDRTWQPTAGTF